MGMKRKILFYESQNSLKFRKKNNSILIPISLGILFLLISISLFVIFSYLDVCLFTYIIPVLTIFMTIFCIYGIFEARKHEETPVIISSDELRYNTVSIPLSNIKRVLLYKNLRRIYPYIEYNKNGNPRALMIRPILLGDLKRLLRIFKGRDIEIKLKGSEKSFEKRGLLIDSY